MVSVVTPAYTSVIPDEMGIIRLHSKDPKINLEIWDSAFLEALSLETQDKSACLLDENILGNMDDYSREYALKSIVFGRKVVAVVVPNVWKRFKLNFKRKRNKSSNIQYFSNASDALSWLKIQMKRMSESIQPIGKN